VFSAEGEFELEPGGTRRLEPCDIVAPGGGIHFGAGWYRVEVYESAPFRWIADEAEIIFRRRHKRETGLFLDVDVGPSAKDGVLSLEIVDSRQSVLATAAVERRSKLRLHIPEHISFASIRLRPICERVPIGADPRFLCLRVYGLRILHAGGGPFFGPQDADDEQESTVKAGLEHRELAVTQTSSNKGWFLEVLETLPSSDWSAMHQHVSPFAKDMLHPAYLHTNGSGDFTLLARQHWWDLRGYAQLPIWPMHVDSILCYSAHHAGIRQKVLREPMRIFHIEHRSGAGWTPEGERERAARIEAKGVGVISNDDLVKWIDQMRRLNAPVILNREDWGLADLDLQERVASCS